MTDSSQEATPDADSGKAKDLVKSPMTQTAVIRRAPLLVSSIEGLKYLVELQRHKEIKFRESDKVSTGFLCGAIVFAGLTLVTPVPDISLAIICDVCFGIAVLYYVLNRFGFVKVLPPREAAFAAELMAGISLLAVYLCINMQILIFLARTYLKAIVNK